MTPIHLTLAAVAALAAAGAAKKRGSRNATTSDAFRRWFGNSEIVDDDGKPLVVYHGTRGYFDSFDPDRPGYAGTQFSEDTNVERQGFFFSTDPKFAGEFSGGVEGSNLIPVYLRAERTRQLDDILISEFENSFDPYDKVEREKWKIGRFATEPYWQLLDGEDGKVFREWLEQKGIDGVWFDEFVEGADGEEIEAVTWVVFEPTQIKSATGNRGTFDPKDPRISYNRREP